LGLNTTPHKNPYPLGWVCEDAKLQVMKQSKFEITTKFFDEVELDVVPFSWMNSIILKFECLTWVKWLRIQGYETYTLT